jgi:CHRD domain-containing protein/PEP-CTERM motif-containing protein
MVNRRRVGLIVFASVLLCLASASIVQADTITFVANLTGSNEVPANGSLGTGSATVTLDTVSNQLTINLTFSGLGSNTTAAHFHCCSPIGINSAVAIGLSGFPAGVQSGSYSNVFDLTSASTYSGGFFANPGGGTVAGAQSAFINGLLNGQVYLNIHTQNLPGGEIRGQVIPEPATVALLMTGLAGVGAAVRRRRKARQID